MQRIERERASSSSSPSSLARDTNVYMPAGIDVTKIIIMNRVRERKKDKGKQRKTEKKKESK